MNHEYPLSWPLGFQRTKEPKPGRFGKRSNKGGIKKLTISQARKRLNAVISAFTRQNQKWVIDPDDVVIASNLVLKVNGMPRVQGEPEDSGVCIYLYMDEEPYEFPCDTYSTLADNITAVAEHLESLRTQQRHGVGTRKQAFSGWARLESTTLDWEKVLGVKKTDSYRLVKGVANQLMKKYHSDTGTGEDDKFQKVYAAFQLAKSHYNVR